MLTNTQGETCQSKHNNVVYVILLYYICYITYTTLCFDGHVLSYVFYKHFGMENINVVC
jgi:hypothetical protein